MALSSNGALSSLVRPARMISPGVWQAEQRGTAGMDQPTSGTDPRPAAGPPGSPDLAHIKAPKSRRPSAAKAGKTKTLKQKNDFTGQQLGVFGSDH